MDETLKQLHRRETRTIFLLVFLRQTIYHIESLEILHRDEQIPSKDRKRESILLESGWKINNCKSSQTGDRKPSPSPFKWGRVMQPMDEDRRGAGSLSINAIHRTCRINVNNESRGVSVDGRRGREDRERERGGGCSGTLPPSNLFSRVGCYARDTYIAPGRQCRLIDIARRGFNT